MAHHYHIVSKLDYSDHGGTKADHSYGAGLPLVWAQDDARALAESINGFHQIAGGVWTDAPDADAFNDDLNGQYHYIYIDPCDNEMEFDIPWNRWRDEVGIFRRAPKGQPCSSLRNNLRLPAVEESAIVCQMTDHGRRKCRAE